MGYGKSLEDIKKAQTPVVAQVVDADRHSKVEETTQETSRPRRARKAKKQS